MWGVRDYEHRRAVNALEARTYERRRPAARLRLSSRGSIPSTGTASSRPRRSLPSRRWSRSAQRSIPRASSKSATSRKKLPLLWPRKSPTSDACIWIGRSIRSPKRKLSNLRRRATSCVFRTLRYMRIPSAITGGRGRRRTLGAAVQLDKNLQVVGDVYDTEKGQLVVPEPGK